MLVVQGMLYRVRKVSTWNLVQKCRIVKQIYWMIGYETVWYGGMRVIWLAVRCSICCFIGSCSWSSHPLAFIVHTTWCNLSLFLCACLTHNFSRVFNAHAYRNFLRQFDEVCSLLHARGVAEELLVQQLHRFLKLDFREKGELASTTRVLRLEQNTHPTSPHPRLLSGKSVFLCKMLEKTRETKFQTERKILLLRLMIVCTTTAFLEFRQPQLKLKNTPRVFFNLSLKDMAAQVRLWIECNKYWENASPPGGRRVTYSWLIRYLI